MKFHITGIVLAALCVGSSAHAQTAQAVEWKVSDGGNGHWYQLDLRPMSWSNSRSAAIARGGDLASLESDAELGWIRNTIPGHPWPSEGCHLGGMQAQGSSSPATGWFWLTGLPITLGIALDFDDNPCGQGCCGENGEQNYLHSYENWQKLGDANEGSFSDSCLASSTAYASLVEWSADCNGDGIVDYGQILRGELADDDHNNIPDVCETSVTGVLPPSVPSQGGVTITINGRNFPDNPTVLVGGTPATNVMRVSTTRLTATTPAGLPGMTSISVNGFTLPDAFYYRPECGSDLDQNGSVDAGDIAIILLDFGPCYEPPAALAAPVPTPLLDDPAQRPVAAKKE